MALILTIILRSRAASCIRHQNTDMEILGSTMTHFTFQTVLPSRRKVTPIHYSLTLYQYLFTLYAIPTPTMPMPPPSSPADIFPVTNFDESLSPLPLPSPSPLNPSHLPSNETPGFVPIPSVPTTSPSSPILNMNFDEVNNRDNPSLPFNSTVLARDFGCQLSSNNTSLVVIREAKKLSIPHFDLNKLSWFSFAMKLHAFLIECDLGYLLTELSTNVHNAAHSKELMLELFKKLQGSAISLLTGLSTQRYYLEGGRGIEMVKALV
jgi:hypothetical protein